VIRASEISAVIASAETLIAEYEKGDVRSARALVRDVQQQHPVLRILVLELLQVLTLLIRVTTNLEELDFVLLQRDSNLLRQIRELDEDEDAVVLRDFVAAETVKLATCLRAKRHTSLLDVVNNLLDFTPKVFAIVYAIVRPERVRRHNVGHPRCVPAFA